RLHPHLGGDPRRAERGRSADHRGSSVEHLPARALPSSFLCEPGGAWGDLRSRAAGLRACLGGARQRHRGRIERGAPLRLGGRLGARLWRRAPLAPDAAAIRTLAGLLAETGLTEIEYAIGDHRIRVAREPAA